MLMNPRTLPTDKEVNICQPPFGKFSQIVPLFTGHPLDPPECAFHISNADRTGGPAFYFQYCLSGTCIFCTHGREYEFCEGRAVLFRVPSDTSYWMPKGASLERIYIAFRGEVAAAIAENLLEQHGPLFDLSLHDKPIRILTSIVSSSVRRRRMSFFDAAGKLYCLLMALCESTHLEQQNYPESVSRALRHMETEYNKPDLQVEDLARCAGLSKAHFSRLFQKHTGHGPACAIRDHRMRASLNLLAFSHLPLKEIATLVGYRDYRSFHRCCLGWCGKTPGQIRQHGGY